MKTIKISILSMLLISIVYSCSNSPSGKNNEYFGKLPGIVKDYTLKYDAKENELEKCTDLETAFKLEKEKDLLEKEMEQKIVEYISTSSICGRQVPIQTIDHNLFTTQKVKIDTAYSSGRVQFQFALKAKENIKAQRCTPFVYFKAIDKEGNDIIESYSVATPYKINIQPGLEFKANGVLNAMVLENFSQIVEISENEYKKHKS
jgi:hypothetical protein